MSICCVNIAIMWSGKKGSIRPRYRVRFCAADVINELNDQLTSSSTLFCITKRESQRSTHSLIALMMAITRG